MDRTTETHQPSNSSGDIIVVQKGTNQDTLEKKPMVCIMRKLNIASVGKFFEEVEKRRENNTIAQHEVEKMVASDFIIEVAGSKDAALLKVVSNKEVMKDEKQVLDVITNLLKRGANPSCINSDGKKTPLHYAVEENCKNVCQKLLEYEAMPEARDVNDDLPYKLALNAENDEIAAILVKSMDNEKIREMYTCPTDREESEFSFVELLGKKMPKTIQAVLDCMMDLEKSSAEANVYYNVLDADGKGKTPEHTRFNWKDKSGFQIISKSRDRNVANHDVVRLLIRKKWHKFGKLRFLIHSVFYLISLITLTFSAVVGSTTSDPSEYDTSALQIVRAICEIWSLGTVFLTLLFELNQLRRHQLEYWQDASNWIDMSSCFLVLSLPPLRFTERNEQWFVFSAAYLLWTLRIFKYAPVFRQTGAYTQILWRILIHDIVQFTTLFTCILLSFSGCLLLSLRGEGSLQQFSETSSFWSILFVGLRILIEAEKIIEYTALQTTSLIIMVTFLFTICVLLLNILIAQLSDTYQKVQQDAQRGLEVNRAWIVAKIELNSLFLRKRQRQEYYVGGEKIPVKSTLETWKNPSLKELNEQIHTVIKITFEKVKTRLMHNLLHRGYEDINIQNEEDK